jgi:hypothetical protein
MILRLESLSTTVQILSKHGGFRGDFASMKFPIPVNHGCQTQLFLCEVNMKNSKSVIAACVLAAASLGSSAVMAADISSPPQALNLIDNSAFFGDSFTMNHINDTFADHFTFTLGSGSLPTNLDAIVSSVSRTAGTGLDITGLDLYRSGGALVMSGTMLESGPRDVWTVASDNLASGDYYVQVSGRLVSNTGGSFGGSLMLAPIPEPETYGMMLAGLGLVGYMARRRKTKQD